MKEVIETFQIHNRINAYLLDSIPEAQLSDAPLNSKGRNVGTQFMHMHQVRLMWLKAAAPELLQDIEKPAEENALNKVMLQDALKKSGDAIELLFKKAAVEGKIKNFKPHPTAFLGYIISHESHHRGQIILCLKQNGHLPDKKILFGVWEWGTR